MTELRYGFRADAERLAIELRGELGLDRHSRIDPYDLAELYGIPVVGVSDLDVPDRFPGYFTGEESVSWSATTVFAGSRRLIVLNDGHGDRRLANSLSHELAHLFLEHEPAPVADEDGTRTWDDTMEAEADELGAQILIPDETAKELTIRGYSAEDIADRFGVSCDLASWRMGVSGGLTIRSRIEAKR